ncbi:MAG TPA: NAD-dependent epimerase/dehydratase family protein [Steroidobacteraceae bacterium]|jgi:UDP-glucose 4-epimerase|nr:NAD-dependent epimerase/dehydratase family protein [Steroidobacteraceae bacterium]
MAEGIYLITGGASLIGSHIADELLRRSAREVRLLDNYSLGTPATIAHLEGDTRVKRLRGDVQRMPDLMEAMKGVDGVFALAGYLTLPMAQDPLSGVSVNTLGMVNTLEACRFSGVRRIIFSSSVAVYGSPVDHPITEDTGYASAGLQPPSLLYGASKLMGEALCARYARSYGLQYNSLRFASVYGERQHARAVNAVFVARICDQVQRGEGPVIEGDGSEVHDYVYVTDVARACVLAMHSASHGHALNIATGVDTTSTRIAQIALQLCKRPDLKPVYREDKRAVRSAAGTRLGFSRDKAAREIAWQPEVSIEDGMRRLIEWQRGQG